MKFAQSTTGAVVLLSTLAQAVPCVKPKFEEKQVKSFCCNIEKSANDPNIVTDLPGMVGTPCALYKIKVQEGCPQGSTDKKKCKVRVQSAETVPPTNWISVTQFPDIVDTPGGVKNFETHVKGKIYKPEQTPGQTTNDFIQQYKPSQEPKNEEDEDACVQELSATSGQPGQPGHDGKGGEGREPGQPGQPGQPGHDGKGGEGGKPGHPGQPGQPGHDGKGGEGGKPGQPGQPGQPGHDGKGGEGGEPGQPGQPGQPGGAGHGGVGGSGGGFGGSSA